MSDIISRPYHPDPQMACGRCVWGRGDHAEWCDSAKIVAYLQKRIRAAMQELSDYFLDMPIVVAEGAPRDCIGLIAMPEPYETLEEYQRRCTAIIDIGESASRGE